MRGRGWTVLLALATFVPARLPAQGALFASDTPLAVTLRADFHTLLRNPDDSTTWRDAVLQWSDSTGTHTVGVQLRQRGHYRRRRCGFPPLRLKLEADSVRGTVFAHARHPKLVTHCENRDEYEQNLLKEYGIYRVLGLVTPASFRVRLLRVTYEDTHGSARPITRDAILVEDVERLAGRLGGTVVEIPSVRMSDLRASDMAQLGVFEYFVGNTDWSVPGLHNIQLIRTSDTVIAIPYDFDWTGVVEARYARPDPRLRAATVRERIYRGRCLGASDLEPALARFEALRDSIAVVWRAIPGLERENLERTLRYFDEFYGEIRDRQRFVRNVVEPTCLRG